MYTIKQAAARTGVAVPTIRAWERRYGVVSPARTAAGYRLYDEEAIARLSAMRRLVENDGWRPSQAAERVREPDADLAALGRPATPLSGAGSTDLGPARDGTPADAESRDPALASVERFVGATRALDIAALQDVLDDAFASRRFERGMAEVVFPALRAIGEGWSADAIDVAMEHAASETVRRRLAGFFDAAARDDRAPDVVVGLPPGSHHEIGAFAFAVAARRAGTAVLYLGADVPLESWLRTVREVRPAAVVLGVVTAADVAAATVVVEALGTLPEPPVRLLGGPLAHDVEVLPDGGLLPDDLEDAVATVERTIADRR